MARGKYFARMDGDDLMYPERLARQFAYLEAHREVDLLGTGVLVFRSAGEPLGIRQAASTHESVCARPWSGFLLAHPTWMGKTSWFRANPYDPKAIRIEDQELLLRTYRFSRFAALSEILVGFREEQISVSKMLVGRKNYLKALVRHRRRLLPLACAAAIVKTIAGVTAVATGLDYKLLRNRAGAATAADIQRWLAVLEGLQSFRVAPYGTCLLGGGCTFTTEESL